MAADFRENMNSLYTRENLEVHFQLRNNFSRSHDD